MRAIDHPETKRSFDLVMLHARPCRLCDAGRLIVAEIRGTQTVHCTDCGSSARSILASYSLPFALLVKPRTYMVKAS